ncbi:unnamed protein product [Paramecium pentaurelia]|uniref:MORN repeat protein n=1 Tax=Paramecium pentaurelia TaxID=43138 RepID=A0A8S1VKK2_9CILI|nr:unnamed protein product [Paramecium pentaurelia]
MESFIDLTQLEPIPYKNTIAVLNEYMLQNIDFLNKFGHFNENKLFEMEVVLDEIESKVLLLEKKLESIPPEFFNGLVVPPLQQQQQVAQPQAVEPQNKEYEGEWKDSKMNGQGEFRWNDGRKYIGSYKNDKKDGYGEFNWPDGKYYKGQWKDGKQHGIALYKGKDMPNERQCYFEEGKRTKWIE